MDKDRWMQDLREWRESDLIGFDETPDMPHISASAEDAPIRTGVITEKEIGKARELLTKYRQGKQVLDNRIVENDQWWRLRHWDVVKRQATGDPEPASAWLFNSVANKHGDMMDNAPAPVVLPREQADEQDAKTLSDILPVILEHNDFEATYSDAAWDKLKSGTSAYCVTWDRDAENGLGEISIKRASMLNLFWEPMCSDIQDSPNLFYCALVDNDALEAMYPEIKDQIGMPMEGQQYIHEDSADTSNMSMVVDWYYKRMVGTKTVLHYCKFCGTQVLYASENDPLYAERGFYDHGKYPFVLDRLFPMEDSPAGFGYIDIMKSPQLYIDRLDSIILKNAAMAGKPRWFYRDSCGVNQDEFADWNRDFVHVAGRLEDGDLRQIKVDNLPAYLINHVETKVAELKETSGNRDFAQGGTVSGVTAAAAIAALQEAGNKLSRDLLKGSYRAYKRMIHLCIELVRQFYTTEREFRITGSNGQTDFIRFSGRQIGDQVLPPVVDGGEPGTRRPIFDLDVRAQKSNPYSQLSQNETAKELYGLGVFQPQNADQALALLDMMEFEGVDAVRERVEQNGTLFNQVQQLTGIVQKLTLVLQQNGIDLTGLAAGLGAEEGSPAARSGNTMGSKAKNAETSTMTAYGERLARNATPNMEAQ